MSETLKSIQLVYRLLLAVSVAMLAFAFTARRGVNVDEFITELERCRHAFTRLPHPCEIIEAREMKRFRDKLAGRRIVLGSVAEGRLLRASLDSGATQLFNPLAFGAISNDEAALLTVETWGELRTGSVPACEGEVPGFPPVTALPSFATATATLEGMWLTLTYSGTVARLPLPREPASWTFSSTATEANLWRDAQNDKRVWNMVSALSLKEAIPQIRAMDRADSKEVNLGGVPVSAGLVGLAGPIALLLLLFDILVHVEFIGRHLGKRTEVAQELAAFPWSPIMGHTRARVAGWFSLYGAPGVATISVAASSPSAARCVVAFLCLASGYCIYRALEPKIAELRSGASKELETGATRPSPPGDPAQPSSPQSG